MEIVFRTHEGGTIVAFEHRGLDAFADAARDSHVSGMDQGWGMILARYMAEADSAA